MPTTYPTITSPQDLEQAIQQLIKIDPRFQKLYDLLGLPPLRFPGSGYQALFDAILGQQISTSAANAIKQRLEDAGFNNAERILEASSEELRSFGLSSQKTTYLKSLASHNINYEELAQIPDEEVIKILTAVKGIGTWTAEIYLIFSLHRSDICAHNDLALRKASQVFLALDYLPNEREMRKLWEIWSPYRSAASYLLWSYYRYLKDNNQLP